MATEVLVVGQVRELSNAFQTQQFSVGGGKAQRLTTGNSSYADLIIRNHPSSAGAIELFGVNPSSPAAAYGAGMPLFPGESLALSNFTGQVFCVSDPTKAGSDVRLAWDIAVTVQRVAQTQINPGGAG